MGLRLQNERKWGKLREDKNKFMIDGLYFDLET
jgi:hypothetical protein